MSAQSLRNWRTCTARQSSASDPRFSSAGHLAAWELDRLMPATRGAELSRLTRGIPRRLRELGIERGMPLVLHGSRLIPVTQAVALGLVPNID